MRSRQGEHLYEIWIWTRRERGESRTSALRLLAYEEITLRQAFLGQV